MTDICVEIRPLQFEDIYKNSDKIVAAVSRLISQLTKNPREITKEVLLNIVSQSHVKLFLLVQGDDVIGMFTAVLYEATTRRTMLIEDVVVDEKFRRQGLGRKLTEFGIRWAYDNGVDMIELTSRPSRIEANNMYKILKFILRETNVYRYDLRRLSSV